MYKTKMRIRRLLICSSPRNDIEARLKKMYLKRVKEMFKRAITVESPFNVFDEVFHGLAQTLSISENLHSFFESFLTITQYYQHSQAGKGILVARLLEELGTSEKMEFEFVLNKLPQFLGQNIEEEETQLTNLKFDIISKNEENLALCELKMKVYSGCSAGRIELMQKFNKFIKLIIENRGFRNILKSGAIQNVYLIGGVLFNIEGTPATTQGDEEWGICYNGLIRARNDIVKTLQDKNVEYSLDEEKIPERAFVIEFIVDDVKVKLIAVYGNEVIKSLFIGKQKHDLAYFKQQLEGMFYDDLWLGQIISLSERTILDQNFKKNKKLDNYILAILRNATLIAEIRKLQSQKNEAILREITSKAIGIIKTSNKDLLSIRPIPAELIIKSAGEEYSLEEYITDIIQFLSCNYVVKELKKEMLKIE